MDFDPGQWNVNLGNINLGPGFPLLKSPVGITAQDNRYLLFGQLKSKSAFAQPGSESTQSIWACTIRDVHYFGREGVSVSGINDWGLSWSEYQH